MAIAGEYLDSIKTIDFAIADGFSGPSEMADWFSEQHGLPFSGIVIYWE
jgi:hypothetical protein